MVRDMLRRLLPTSVLVVVAVLVGGAAYAYWPGSGRGAGSVPTGAVTAVTLTPGTPDASLHPGGTANVELTVSNPNTSAVHIGSLALDTAQGSGGFTVDADHYEAGCTAAAARLGFTQSRVGLTVPAKGSLPLALRGARGTGALGMGLDAASECQGAIFTVYLVARP